MGKTRFTLGAFLLISSLPAIADSRFTIRQMNRNDVPQGKAQCDIRLQVDGEVELSVDRDRVFIRTLSGQDARDDGSECNVPLPGSEVAGFNFEVKDSRGDIRLVEGPSRRNGGRVIVRIRDSKGGFGRYHFRLSWAMYSGGGPSYPGPRPPQPPPPPPPTPEYGRDFQIISAFWGVPGRGRDVTRIVQDRMRGGRLRIRATNEEIGFDPAVGQVKTLVVVYQLRGRRQEARVAENDYLELP